MKKTEHHSLNCLYVISYFIMNILKSFTVSDLLRFLCHIELHNNYVYSFFGYSVEENLILLFQNWWD